MKSSSTAPETSQYIGHNNNLRLVAVGLLLPVLGGCAAATGDYPSLAIRDAERATGTFSAVVAPYTQPPTPAAALDQLDSLVNAARTSHRQFEKAAPAAERTVTNAAGQSQGSERWAQAQLAIAGLEAARSQVIITLADLDQLYISTVTEGSTATPIEAAIQEISLLVDTENTLIEGLLAKLN